jgi:membrane protein
LFGRAAQLAYNFFLALFPALIFITALLGLLAGTGTRLYGNLVQYIGTALPGSAFELVRKTLDETTKASSGGKLTFGIMAALWLATAGMTAIVDTLHAVFNRRDQQSFWRAQGLALGLTVISTILAIMGLSIIMCGDTLATLAANHLGLGAFATLTWKIVQWPIALFFLSLVFAIIYYFAPDVERRHWAWLTPGAIVGVVSWIVASAALRLYVHFFDSYSVTYGSLGAVIILLTWFYVTGLMLLLGAEVNAAIENAVANRDRPTPNGARRR